MTREAIEPAGLYPSRPYGFSQVIVAEAARTVYCAGIVAWDEHQTLVGPGDFAAQMAKALDNVHLALASAGATPADVVHLRLYIVDYNPGLLTTIGAQLNAFFGSAAPAANTVLGVQCLALPDLLIEIEATAVLGGRGT